MSIKLVCDKKIMNKPLKAMDFENHWMGIDYAYGSDTTVISKYNIKTKEMEFDVIKRQ